MIEVDSFTSNKNNKQILSRSYISIHYISAISNEFRS